MEEEEMNDNSEISDVEKAKKLLQEEDNKKTELFIKEYSELCKKYNKQIVINGLSVANLQ